MRIFWLWSQVQESTFLLSEAKCLKLKHSSKHCFSALRGVASQQPFNQYNLANYLLSIQLKVLTSVWNTEKTLLRAFIHFKITTDLTQREIQEKWNPFGISLHALLNNPLRRIPHSWQVYNMKCVISMFSLIISVIPFQLLQSSLGIW